MKNRLKILFYSVPIEYLTQSKLVNVWNSLGMNKSKINIWSNDGFIKAVKGMKQPKEITYKLNTEETFVNYNLDELDIKVKINYIFFKKEKQKYR